MCKKGDDITRFDGTHREHRMNGAVEIKYRNYPPKTQNERCGGYEVTGATNREHGMNSAVEMKYSTGATHREHRMNGTMEMKYRN